MQVVAIGVQLTCQHFSHIETFQSTTNGLYFFQSVNFETCRGKRITDLLRCEVEIDVFLQPLIRNIHF